MIRWHNLIGAKFACNNYVPAKELYSRTCFSDGESWGGRLIRPGAFEDPMLGGCARGRSSYQHEYTKESSQLFRLLDYCHPSPTSVLRFKIPRTTSRTYHFSAIFPFLRLSQVPSFQY